MDFVVFIGQQWKNMTKWTEIVEVHQIFSRNELVSHRNFEYTHGYICTYSDVCSYEPDFQYVCTTTVWTPGLAGRYRSIFRGIYVFKQLSLARTDNSCERNMHSEILVGPTSRQNTKSCSILPSYNHKSL